MATMPTLVLEALTVEVAKLSLKPGDVLLLTFAGCMRREDRVNIQQCVEQVIAPNRCLVLTGGLEASVLEHVNPDAVVEVPQ